MSIVESSVGRGEGFGNTPDQFSGFLSDWLDTNRFSHFDKGLAVYNPPDVPSILASKSVKIKRDYGSEGSTFLEFFRFGINGIFPSMTHSVRNPLDGILVKTPYHLLGGATLVERLDDDSRPSYSVLQLCQNEITGGKTCFGRTQIPFAGETMWLTSPGPQKLVSGHFRTLTEAEIGHFVTVVWGQIY